MRSLSAQHIQATEGIFDRHPFLRRAHVILLQFINAGLDCTVGLFDAMRQSSTVSFEHGCHVGPLPLIFQIHGLTFKSRRTFAACLLTTQ